MKVTPSDELKNYEADGFQLFAPEDAGIALLLLLALAMLLDAILR
jgi:hypothetical protein